MPHAPQGDVPLPSLTVIIPAHNEERVIEGTVCTVAEAVPSGSQVLVVDDGSSDETPGILAILVRRFAYLEVLRNPTPQGKPAALNRALDRAWGEVILLLDADVRVDATTLRTCLVYLASTDVAALAVDLAPYNRRFSLGFIFQDVQFALMKAFLFSGLLGLPFLSGSCLLVRRQALERVGKYSPDSLADDFNLGLRLLQAGQRVCFLRGPRCHIQYAPSMRSFLRQQQRWIRGGIDELWREVVRGRWRYAGIAALGLLILYSAPLAILADLSFRRWVVSPIVAPALGAGFAVAAWAAYLRERPSPLEAGLALPLCAIFLPTLQAAVASAAVSALVRGRGWYKAPRDRG